MLKMRAGNSQPGKDVAGIRACLAMLIVASQFIQVNNVFVPRKVYQKALTSKLQLTI
jgi:hypothetical protein